MTPRSADDRPISPITAAANAFVEAHRATATRLGTELGDLVDDPEAFVLALHAGFAGLTDETYRNGQLFIAPGLTDPIGIRLPLLSAMRHAFDRASGWAGADSLLWLTDRLLREPGLEIRMFAFRVLIRVLPDDAERGWQLLRRAARAAHEWITVDELAHAYGVGILLEPFRWSEIEQLAYSPSPWERRLVGSTIATIPFVKRREGRQPEIARRALPIVGNLIGDADPDVQKALAWALRSTALVDQAAVARFVEEQSTRAAATNDGGRAWVLRDALPALPADEAAPIRERLVGIRRRPNAPSTSDAAEMAARFAGLVNDTAAADGPRTAIDFDREPKRGPQSGGPSSAPSAPSGSSAPSAGTSSRGPDRSSTGVTA